MARYVISIEVADPPENYHLDMADYLVTQVHNLWVSAPGFRETIPMSVVCKFRGQTLTSYPRENADNDDVSSINDHDYDCECEECDA